MIKVGDICKESSTNEIYVVMHIDINDESPLLLLMQDGSLWQTTFSNAEEDTLIKHYDNVIDAIRSKEFDVKD